MRYVVTGLGFVGVAACTGLDALSTTREAAVDTAETDAAGPGGGDPVDIPDTAAPGGAETDGTETGETSDTGETGETGDTAPPPFLAWNTAGWTSAWEDAIVVDGVNEEVLFLLETTGGLAGGSAQLWLADLKFAGDYDEEHTLSRSQLGPPSTFDRILACDVAFGAQVTDVSTVFDYLNSSSGVENDITPEPNSGNWSVGVAAAVWPVGASAATDPPADCIVFGYPGTGTPSPMLDPGFATDTTDGHVPPAWLTVANCRQVP